MGQKSQRRDGECGECLGTTVGFFVSMLDGNPPLRLGAEDDCGWLDCPVADIALTKWGI